MSEARRWTVQVLLPLALAAGGAHAQVGQGSSLRDPAIENANLAKLEQLAAEARRLRQLAATISDSSLGDTVREGRFRIATTPEYVDFARGIARRAEARVAATLRTTPSTAMTFAMRDNTAENQKPRRVMLERWVDGRRDAAVRLRVEPGRIDGEDFLVHSIAEERFASLDSATKEWLRGPLLPTINRAQERSAVYVELASTDNRIVADCRDGKLERCREGFAFALPPDPILTWYEPVNRRRIASRSLQRRRRDPLVERCAAGNDGACIAELRTWGTRELPPPLTVGARHSLVWVALGLGGDGALERFESSTATNVEQRLADAARTSPTTLIGAWRDSVIAARPRSVTASGGTAWAAVFWGGLLGILSMRSSRWRAR